MLFLYCGENVAWIKFVGVTYRWKDLPPDFPFPTKINVPYDPLLLFICLAFEKRFWKVRDFRSCSNIVLLFFKWDVNKEIFVLGW